MLRPRPKENYEAKAEARYYDVEAKLAKMSHTL